MHNFNLFTAVMFQKIEQLMTTTITMILMQIDPTHFRMLKIEVYLDGFLSAKKKLTLKDR